jgi:putative pyruvate formate lyase activating enzyme
MGCENINFVTPTHVTHAVAQSIHLARQQGLSIPTVYNCSGYESLHTLELLEGLIDIYMPDFKYADTHAAEKYSHAEDYPAIAAAALQEMYRQVGSLRLNNYGIAVRGVLVRHLVMPHDLAQSENIVRTIARIAPKTAINIMQQYHPDYKAFQYPELSSHPSLKDVNELRHLARSLELVPVDH